MIETLANGYSSDSAQQELSNEYQYEKDDCNIFFALLWIGWK